MLQNNKNLLCKNKSLIWNFIYRNLIEIKILSEFYLEFIRAIHSQIKKQLCVLGWSQMSDLSDKRQSSLCSK